MRTFRWVSVVLVCILPCTWAGATGWRKESTTLLSVNSRLAGQVIDHTANHGKDRRIWSPALCQRRDLYVYLPPHFDPHKQYPLLVWFHGFAQDEGSFLTIVAPILDKAICAGKLPPLIAVAPDGTIDGEQREIKPGSFFINSQVGRFEDYIMHDVLSFVSTNYPVRPERQSRVFAGLSMGGFGAFSLGIKHRDQVGTVVGIYPPLNLRWVDAQGHYFAPFDPNNWGWREKVASRHEVVARFCGGLVTFTIGQVIEPIFGRGEMGLQEVTKNNPIELIDNTHLRPGELEMYVCYGKKDEFNMAAQIESFIYRAHQRGIEVGVGVDPEGHHDMSTALHLIPGLIDWLGPRIAH